MINNEELPIGFTMELAQHSDALVRFSGMTKDEKQEDSGRGRNEASREGRRHLVEYINKSSCGDLSLFIDYPSHSFLPNTLSNTQIQMPATKTAGNIQLSTFSRIAFPIQKDGKMDRQ